MSQEPEIFQARGGWCAKYGEFSISGPWATEEAARAAGRGDFPRAHEIDSAATPPELHTLRCDPTGELYLAPAGEEGPDAVVSAPAAIVPAAFCGTVGEIMTP